MFQPSSRKYKKSFKGRISSITFTGAGFTTGEYGLKAMESGRVTTAQIEAVRKVISRYVKKLKKKIIIRIFAYKPVSKKPAQTRMGGGKGSVDHWVAMAEAGRMLFEIEGEGDEDIVVQALSLARYKLPIKTKVIKRLI